MFLQVNQRFWLAMKNECFWGFCDPMSDCPPKSDEPPQHNSKSFLLLMAMVCESNASI